MRSPCRSGGYLKMVTTEVANLENRVLRRIFGPKRDEATEG
jgi:hypothetical protein